METWPQKHARIRKLAHATTEVTITTRAGRLNGDMTVGAHQFWTLDHAMTTVTHSVLMRDGAMTVHGGGTVPQTSS